MILRIANGKEKGNDCPDMRRYGDCGNDRILLSFSFFTVNSDPSMEDLRSNNVEISFVFFYEVPIIESV